MVLLEFFFFRTTVLHRFTICVPQWGYSTAMDDLTLMSLRRKCLRLDCVLVTDCQETETVQTFRLRYSHPVSDRSAEYSLHHHQQSCKVEEVEDERNSKNDCRCIGDESLCYRYLHPKSISLRSKYSKAHHNRHRHLQLHTSPQSNTLQYASRLLYFLTLVLSILNHASASNALPWDLQAFEDVGTPHQPPLGNRDSTTKPAVKIPDLIAIAGRLFQYQIPPEAYAIQYQVSNMFCCISK